MSAISVDIVVERGRPLGGDPFRLEAAFETEDGITVVCGPSGGGKSTLLLAVLGALRPASGRIALGGTTLFDAARGVEVPVRLRRVGMVFQEATLFPHLDVLRNVAFGIACPHARRAAAGLLERVGALDLADRRPHELSGGQRQRVALARALAAEPSALLLDEPFSALDPAARRTLATLLAELQAGAGIPFVHVTHDLGEALRLGTRLVLLAAGAIVQIGVPGEVIARPASLAAARAVGTENVLRGTVRRHLETDGCSEIDLGGLTVYSELLDRAVGSPLDLGLRAEDVLLSLAPIRGTSARNVIPGTIEAVSGRGHAVEVRVATPLPVRVLLTPAAVRELDLKEGKPVWLLIKASSFQLLD